MIALFVGDKPSAKSDPLRPFTGAKCEKRFLQWARFVCESINYKVINQCNFTTNSLQNTVYTLNLPVVALGKQASKALTKAEIPHFVLPHPSGLNRQVNDAEYVENMLKRARNYVKAKKTL